MCLSIRKLISVYNFLPKHPLLRSNYPIRWLLTSTSPLSKEVIQGINSSDQTSLNRNPNPAQETLEVFSTRDRHLIDAEVVITKLTELYESHKTARGQMLTEDVVTDARFLQLCTQLKRNLRELSVLQTLDAFKILLYFKVPHNSILVQLLMKLLMDGLNELPLDQIVFLMFLLKSLPQDTKTTALRIALPVVFETHLKTKLDLSSVHHLVYAFKFSTTYKLSQSSLDYTAKCLIDLPKEKWKVMPDSQAKTIIMGLCQMYEFSECHEILLCKSLDIMKSAPLFDMEQMLALCSRKSIAIPFFYNEEFYKSSAESVILMEGSFKECGWVLRNLNRVGHVNIPLLDYMSRVIAKNPQVVQEAPFSIYMAYVSGLALADYKPPADWQPIADTLRRRLDDLDDRQHLPWVKLCLNLACLDIFNENLIRKVYCSVSTTGQGSLTWAAELVLLHQVVSTTLPSFTMTLPQDAVDQIYSFDNQTAKSEYPLGGALEHILGGTTFMATGCSTKLGHFVDHMFVLDQDGYPVSLDSNSISNVEDLQVPDKCHRVIVVVFPKSWHASNIDRPQGICGLTLRSLQALGYSVVAVSIITWKNLQNFEKVSYLREQIQLSTGQLVQAANTAANLRNTVKS